MYNYINNNSLYNNNRLNNNMIYHNIYNITNSTSSTLINTNNIAFVSKKYDKFDNSNDIIDFSYEGWSAPGSIGSGSWCN